MRLFGFGAPAARGLSTVSPLGIAFRLRIIRAGGVGLSARGRILVEAEKMLIRDGHVAKFRLRNLQASPAAADWGLLEMQR